MNPKAKDISKDFEFISNAMKVLRTLHDSFSFSSYNPMGDYAVISFNIKTKEERDLINDVLFSGCEIV